MILQSFDAYIYIGVAEVVQHNLLCWVEGVQRRLEEAVASHPLHVVGKTEKAALS